MIATLLGTLYCVLFCFLTVPFWRAFERLTWDTRATFRRKSTREIVLLPFFLLLVFSLSSLILYHYKIYYLDARDYCFYCPKNLETLALLSTIASPAFGYFAACRRKQRKVAELDAMTGREADITIKKY